MEKKLIPTAMWNEMDDLEQVNAVVAMAEKPADQTRPTYAYLVEFIDHLGSVLKEEKDDYRYAIKTNYQLVIALLATGVFAIIGWIL